MIWQVHGRQQKKKPASKTPAKKPAIKKTIPKQSTKTRAKSGAATKIAPVKVSKTSEDSGVLLDEATTELDFCGVELNARRYAFLVNYLTPGGECFHNALKSAMKAGYSEETAKARIYKIMREPDMQRIISANAALAFQSLHEAAKMAIEVKKQRALYKPSDFFQRKKIVVTTKKGKYEIEKVELKPLEEMTDLQQMCVDGIEIKGQASIPVYTMPDRGKELNEIIKMDADWSKSIADTGEEETREIIIERITVRETKRAQRPAELEYEIIEQPVETAEEDEDDV